MVDPKNVKIRQGLSYSFYKVLVRALGFTGVSHFAYFHLDVQTNFRLLAGDQNSRAGKCCGQHLPLLCSDKQLAIMNWVSQAYT